MFSETLNKLISDMTEARKRFQEEAQKEFLKATKALFEEVPEVKVIKWTQYTPYFMDGDECVFRVNEPVFSNAEGVDLEKLDIYEYSGENENVWVINGDYGDSGPIPELGQKKDRALHAFKSLIQTDVFQDVMKEIFGDHAVVTITAEGYDADLKVENIGIEVDQWDHD